MLKNLSFLALAGALTFTVSTGCIVVTDDGTNDVGDGDGDPTTGGDGDGDQTGDGDGEPGDGDGDEPGDGDGDEPGDGDGDEPGGACGWDQDGQFGPAYYCGGDGEDPTGSNPFACPDDLVEGDPCGTVTGEGCCDAEGNLWYCAQVSEDVQELFLEEC